MINEASFSHFVASTFTFKVLNAEVSNFSFNGLIVIFFKFGSIEFTFILIWLVCQITFQSEFKAKACMKFSQLPKEFTSFSNIQTELLIALNSFSLFTFIKTGKFFFVSHETFIMFFQIVNQFSGVNIAIFTFFSSTSHHSINISVLQIISLVLSKS
jgi:hypothetical protein